MGVFGYVVRIGFVVLVAVAFNYRTQIMEVINRTLDRAPSTSGLPEPQQDRTEEARRPDAPIKGPTPDYYNPPFDPEAPPEPLYSKSGHRLLTNNELAAHGHSGPLKPIWLALMGKVFNVDRGAEHHYGPNGGYKFFTGTSKLKFDCTP